MIAAFLGLGSNLGARHEHLAAALTAIDGWPDTRVEAVSPLYETDYQGSGDSQPDYLNAVVRIATECGPRELLELALDLERTRGRIRGEAMAPRTLDVDLLLYGDLVLEEPGVSIPHPRLASRRFVLEPLLAVADGVRIPPQGRTVRSLLREPEVQAQRIIETGSREWWEEVTS